MIFDSVYDVYRGVVTYVRVIDGRIEARDRIKMMSTGAVHELLETRRHLAGDGEGRARSASARSAT